MSTTGCESNLQICFIPKRVFTLQFTQAPFSPASHRCRLLEGAGKGEMKSRSSGKSHRQLFIARQGMLTSIMQYIHPSRGYHHCERGLFSSA